MANRRDKRGGDKPSRKKDKLDFSNKISHVFSECLDIYVSAQEENLNQMLDQFARDFKSALMFPDDDGSHDEGAKVLVTIRYGQFGRAIRLWRGSVRPDSLGYDSERFMTMLCLSCLPQVLPSSGDMFVFFRNSMVQCSSLSTGQPLFELYAVFKRVLGYACDGLPCQLPPPGILDCLQHLISFVLDLTSSFVPTLH